MTAEAAELAQEGSLTASEEAKPPQWGLPLQWSSGDLDSEEGLPGLSCLSAQLGNHRKVLATG